MKKLIRIWLLCGVVPCLGQEASLKEVFKGSFRMGTAVNEEMMQDPMVKRQFNTVTPENIMKAEELSPSPGVYDFTKADAFVRWAEGMHIVGHTLIWHNQTPAWFFEKADGSRKSPEEVKEQLRVHIEKVAGRYAGRVHAWDVVNEVIDDDGSYRPTLWVNGVGSGDELVKLAFKYASQYAPNTELYYNDFNAWRPEKVKGIVRMVKMLQAEGIRIDGVGIQGHWGLNYPKNQYIEEAIDAYAACGIKVMITELDVDVLPLTREGQIIGQGMMHKQFQNEEFKTYLDPYRSGLPVAVEEALAARYRELFALFYRKRAKIDRVTVWGMRDGMSWKNDYPIPGRINYPLLWNRDGSAKPAFSSVVGVIQP
jgi:endo-1,4-beta-xylanase